VRVWLVVLVEVVLGLRAFSARRVFRLYCERKAQHVRLKKEEEEDAVDGRELVVDERGSVAVRLGSRPKGRNTSFILLVKEVFGVGVIVVDTRLIGASWVKEACSSTIGV
jgi:hypothetical protein